MSSPIRSTTVLRLAVMTAALVSMVAVAGCASDNKPYGTERTLSMAGMRQQVWAIAPAINLSGQEDVDPLLQSDLLYDQLQAVRGVKVVPVNRVAQLYAALKLEKVESADQAAVVCDLLGCDGLLVPTVTQFDPYSPPKFGGSLELFAKPRNFAVPVNVDPRDLVRSASPPQTSTLQQSRQQIARDGAFAQSVGMFDASNGSVRQAVLDYAVGRNDPQGPLGAKEYFVNMDRYCAFAYHALLQDLVNKVSPRT